MWVVLWVQPRSSDMYSPRNLKSVTHSTTPRWWSVPCAVSYLKSRNQWWFLWSSQCWGRGYCHCTRLPPSGPPPCMVPCHYWWSIPRQLCHQQIWRGCSSCGWQCSRGWTAWTGLGLGHSPEELHWRHPCGHFIHLKGTPDITVFYPIERHPAPFIVMETLSCWIHREVCFFLSVGKEHYSPLCLFANGNAAKTT